EEMLLARNSERQGRVIDHDEQGSMEQKKREGYFDARTRQTFSQERCASEEMFHRRVYQVSSRDACGPPTEAGRERFGRRGLQNDRRLAWEIDVAATSAEQ